MHVSRDDHAVQLIVLVRASHGGQNEDKTLLQCSRCHKGDEFWHVSISARQQSLRCGQNLRRPFLTATLLDHALERWRTWGDKGAHNSTTKVSFCTSITRLCHCMMGSCGCSQNLYSPFLRAVRLFTLFTLPGSRLYSDLLDTSVCIHQLVLAARIIVGGLTARSN